MTAMTDTPTYEELAARVRELEATVQQQPPPSSELLTGIVDKGVVGFYVTTPDGRFIWANQAFASILGYDSPEQLKAEVTDIQTQFFLDPGDRRHFRETLERDGSIENFECEMRRRDGDTAWVSENACCRRDPDGRITAYEGMLFDITARRQAEQKQEEAEAFVALLLNSLPVPVFYKDRQGRYLGFNRAFETFFGKNREELIGKTVVDINPSELARIYHEKDEELFTAGGTQRYESRVQNAKGQMRNVIFDKSAYKGRDGKVAGLIGTVLDITDRIRMEAALKKSEERFREMAELLPGAVLESDAKLNITYANRMGMKLFGISDDDIAAGINGLDWICPEHREKAARRVAVRKHGKTVRPTEYRMHTRDGGEIWVQLNASPIVKEGRTTGFRIVLTDINQRKQIEKERENLIAELKAALAEIKTLQGIVPICSKCKKIRDDQGYWNILETFIQEHSEASFSHSICPDCADKLYGHEDWYRKLQDKS
ncbi:MAG TPA: hypothetical protein DHV36_19015 [Desulfobacteraceae bacterium]|nr:hypothetical protein [Desulfobacteraceae bacterium]